MVNQLWTGPAHATIAVVGFGDYGRKRNGRSAIGPPFSPGYCAYCRILLQSPPNRPQCLVTQHLIDVCAEFATHVKRNVLPPVCRYYMASVCYSWRKKDPYPLGSYCIRNRISQLVPVTGLTGVPHCIRP